VHVERHQRALLETRLPQRLGEGRGGHAGATFAAIVRIRHADADTQNHDREGQDEKHAAEGEDPPISLAYSREQEERQRQKRHDHPALGKLRGAGERHEQGVQRQDGDHEDREP